MNLQANLLELARRIEAVIYRINKAAALVASIVLAAMMLLTVADVIGRYFFSKPIRGTWELVGLLLVCAGTWGWGYCQMDKGHVSVTVIIDRLPRKIQAIIRSVTYLIGFVGFSLLCWRMCLRTIKFINLPSGGLTETLEIPYYPFMLVLVIGAGIMALILLIDLLHSLAKVMQK